MYCLIVCDVVWFVGCLFSLYKCRQAVYCESIKTAERYVRLLESRTDLIN